MLIKPKRGTRNQKNVSCDPSKRSFVVKSTGVSVAFARQLDMSSSSATNSVVGANDTFNSERPRNIIGNDVRRHRSNASGKLIKTPARISPS